MKRLVLVIATAIVLSSSKSYADDKAEVKSIAKKSIDAIVVLLRDDKLTEAECKAKVKGELLAVFDLPLTAKLTLGRTYWPRLNAEQRKTFQALFIDNLVDTYFDKAKLFSDKEILYEDTELVGNKIHVPIHCTSKGEKITINNKFYKSKDGWKVYDMEIQDISIVKSYGSQYAAILKDGSVDDLLAEMRKTKPKTEKKEN